MLDLELVDNTIKELENSDTTFITCDKLASLYIVRYFNESAVNRVIIDESPDNVQRELADILPSYKQYCEIKRDYQLNHVGKEAVIDKIAAVCKEITEFLHTLYSSTDLPEERAIIEGNLSNLEL